MIPLGPINPILQDASHINGRERPSSDRELQNKRLRISNEECEPARDPAIQQERSQAVSAEASTSCVQRLQTSESRRRLQLRNIPSSVVRHFILPSAVEINRTLKVLPKGRTIFNFETWLIGALFLTCRQQCTANNIAAAFKGRPDLTNIIINALIVDGELQLDTLTSKQRSLLEKIASHIEVLDFRTQIVSTELLRDIRALCPKISCLCIGAKSFLRNSIDGSSSLIELLSWERLKALKIYAMNRRDLWDRVRLLNTEISILSQLVQRLEALCFENAAFNGNMPLFNPMNMSQAVPVGGEKVGLKKLIFNNVSSHGVMFRFSELLKQLPFGLQHLHLFGFDEYENAEMLKAVMDVIAKKKVKNLKIGSICFPGFFGMPWQTHEYCALISSSLFALSTGNITSQFKRVTKQHAEFFKQIGCSTPEEFFKKLGPFIVKLGFDEMPSKLALKRLKNYFPNLEELHPNCPWSSGRDDNVYSISEERLEALALFPKLSKIHCKALWISGTSFRAFCVDLLHKLFPDLQRLIIGASCKINRETEGKLKQLGIKVEHYNKLAHPFLKSK